MGPKRQGYEQLHVEVDSETFATLQKISKYFDLGPFGRPRLGKAVQVACETLETVLEDPYLRIEVLSKLLPDTPPNKVARRDTKLYMVRPNGSRYDMDGAHEEP